jgi:cytoskeletal protein RodZ
MKNSVKSLLVAAAVTGLLGAVVVPTAVAEDPKPATQTTEKDKNSCKAAAKDAKDSKDAKAKKTASSKDKKAASTAKDKNSCKAANGCSAKEEKKN